MATSPQNGSPGAGPEVLEAWLGTSATQKLFSGCIGRMSQDISETLEQ